MRLKKKISKRPTVYDLVPFYKQMLKLSIRDYKKGRITKDALRAICNLVRNDV